MRALLLLLLLACGPKPDDPPGGQWTAETAIAEAGEPIFAEVGDPVVLEGAGSVGIQFRWDFGDDDDFSGPSPLASHTWDEPGHFTAVLQATGADGTQATDAVAVTITWPRAGIPPRHSTTLAPVGDSLVAVMPDHDELAIVNRSTGVLSVLNTCSDPRSLSVGLDRFAVACARDEVRIYSHDLALLETVLLPWGSRPFGVVIDPTEAVWVSLQGTGELVRVEAGAVVEQIAVGPDLRGLAATFEGLLVSRHRSGPDGGQLWRVNPTVIAWDLAPDPGPDSDTDARGVPTYLERIAVRPDGRVAAIGGLKANIERGIVRDGRPLTHESTTRAILRQVALIPGAGIPGAEVGEPSFDDRDRVSAMTWNPRGDWLFVAHHGARLIDIVDSYSLERVGAFHDVGHGPDGLWVDEEGQVLWVLASLSRELIALDLTDLFGPQVELDRIDLGAGRPEPLGDVGLLGKQVFHDASDPRMTASAYMSCASCHLDGDQDRRVWDFTDRGEGVRNTITLLGAGGMNHGPLHWSANFDELQDFEGDIRGPMAGRGFLSDSDWFATADPLGSPKAGLSEELDAMASWLSSLSTAPRSPYRTVDGGLSNEAIAGQSLFNSLATGCADCHPPPTYTDSALLGPTEPLLHDVGTLTAHSGERLGQPLTGLDTPSLRGLHASAPYLHDGRHDTVRALLDANTDDAHGTTSTLSANQLDQLEAFLLSIE